MLLHTFKIINMKNITIDLSELIKGTKFDINDCITFLNTIK
jgi:hypothetical protein